MALCSAHSGRCCCGLFLLFLDFGLAFFENVLYIARVMAVFYTVMVKSATAGVVPCRLSFLPFSGLKNGLLKRRTKEPLREPLKERLRRYGKKK